MTTPIGITRVPGKIANFLFYLYTPSTGSGINNAGNKIVVENNAKDVGIHCVINRDDLPQSDSESKGLYMCPTMRQCRNERRDRFIIARIENNTIFNYYPKEYKVSMNGTLTVRKMSSKYDGMVVWCILMVPLIGAGENTTVIQIAKGTTLSVEKQSIYRGNYFSTTTSLSSPSFAYARRRQINRTQERKKKHHRF